MNASSASTADPSHIPNHCIQLTTGIVPKVVVAKPAVRFEKSPRRG